MDRSLGGKLDPNLVVPMQFRDGERAVPGHLARMFSGIETYRITYAQAIDEANRRQLSEYVGNAAASVLAEMR